MAQKPKTKKTSKPTKQVKPINAPKILVFAIPIVCLFFVALVCICNWYECSSRMFTYPKQIAPYLYEMTFTDYVYDAEMITGDDVEVFGCSSVRNGNFYGRNFDYFYNDTPEFIVHVDATEDRHASVGVAIHNGLREVNLLRGEYHDQLSLIPNLTLDGINDAGVIASINVVPGEGDTGALTGTNPSGEDLHAAYVVRYILDNADSADEAVELLRGRNIYGSAVDGMYLHVMIADEDKTYVVEYLDNQLVAEEKTGDQQIMTNFYTNLPALTENAAGVERYQILQENYAQGDSMVGMRDLLARVKYSNAYAYSTDPLWMSEMIPQSMIQANDPTVMAIFAEKLDNVRKDYWNAVNNDRRAPANTSFWQTTHNSVYDIAEKKLRVTVQEDYTHYYDFSI